jgi:hypothetical protein
VIQPFGERPHSLSEASRLSFTCEEEGAVPVEMLAVRVQSSFMQPAELIVKTRRPVAGGGQLLEVLLVCRGNAWIEARPNDGPVAVERFGDLYPVDDENQAAGLDKLCSPSRGGGPVATLEVMERLDRDRGPVRRCAGVRGDRAVRGRRAPGSRATRSE